MYFLVQVLALHNLSSSKGKKVTLAICPEIPSLWRHIACIDTQCANKKSHFRAKSAICGEQEVLDRMVNLELFRPLQSTVPQVPTLTRPLKIQVAEVEEDLAALGLMEGPVVLIECADVLSQDCAEVQSCVTQEASSPAPDEVVIGCQVDEGPTSCGGQKAVEVTISVPSEAQQTEFLTGA